MSRDNEDFDVYDKAEKLEEADEINEVEEGFMKGYEDDIDEASCSNCNKILQGKEFVEEEIKGKTFRFCTRECAENFESKKEHL